MNVLNRCAPTVSAVSILTPNIQLVKGALLLIFLVCGTIVLAQGKLVDRRDQAEGWYLPVHGEVSVDGKRTKGYELSLYKDNIEIGKLRPNAKGRFELELDIDQMYSVLITMPGYQSKMIYVDTSLPEGLVEYPAYDCFLSLVSENAKNIDPFYSDFPSAIVRYDTEMGGFYHSEHYLTHIQTKLAGYANASF